MRGTAHRPVRRLLAVAMVIALPAVTAAPGTTRSFAETAESPLVRDHPQEPGLGEILRKRWGLDATRDLRNPVVPGGAPAGLFRRVNPDKPCVVRPVLAFGGESPVEAGWYPASEPCGSLPADAAGIRRELWKLGHRSRPADLEASGPPTLPVRPEQCRFDPGEGPFGLWIACSGAGGMIAWTQPGLDSPPFTSSENRPGRALIFPNADPATGRAVLHSYLIAWEGDADGDYQDLLMQVDNVLLLTSDPPLPGILPPGAEARRLAGGFRFVEGPAWNAAGQALYFSDIPANQIIRFREGAAEVVDPASGQSNGLMFDRDGSLVACEGGNRRVTRRMPDGRTLVLADRFEGRKLNSPNDLWLDAAGGLYFTDPRYGRRDDLEQDREAVYYVAADGTIRRVIDDLLRPNGIALSPNGQYLYVVDNEASTLHRYEVLSPGRLGKGERIALVTHPDGMTVDARGRLYVTGYGGIWVLEGDGRWLGMIPTPEWPANCTFGGEDGKTLFITARTGLYAIRTQTRGWHVHLDGPPAGSGSSVP